MNAPVVRSWGGVPAIDQVAHRPAWRDAVADTLSRLVREQGSTLAFGAGRSYGDSCLASSGHVLQMQDLDRFIATDWQTGIVTAEAGLTLQALHAVSIPRGWFVPVTPGTQFVTLGGAVGNDVHGKNHHVRGTFGRHVAAFDLLRSDRGLLRCSPDENADLFGATLGGLGMTGVITQVTLRMMPIRTTRMRSSSRPFRDIHEFFALSAELDPLHEYTVSWFDCLSRGRGVYFAADHAEEGPLQAARSRPLAVPFTPPWSMMNRVSLRLFNSTYHRLHGRPGQGLVDYEPYFYPLDRVRHWNRLYGRPGFQQFQCVLPEEAATRGMPLLLEAVSASGSGSFLAVLKRCGPLPSPGWLSFPMAGTSLALDFPQSAGLARLFVHLDAIVRDHGGRLYPAKDAHMHAEDFRRGYPRWTEVDARRDPAIRSRFWERVTR